MSEWINVEEKLPNDTELCLVFCGAAGFHIVQYDGSSRSNHWIPTYGGCCFNQILWSLQFITHWMPLPEAPK